MRFADQLHVEPVAPAVETVSRGEVSGDPSGGAGGSLTTEGQHGEGGARGGKHGSLCCGAAGGTLKELWGCRSRGVHVQAGDGWSDRVTVPGLTWTVRVCTAPPFLLSSFHHL